MATLQKVFTGTIEVDDIRIATTAGLTIQNVTPADGTNTVQRSPSIVQQGTGWTGAASQIALFRSQVRPISGTNPIKASLAWSVKIASGSEVDVMSVDDAGNLISSLTMFAPTVGANLVSSDLFSVQLSIEFSQNHSIDTSKWLVMRAADSLVIGVPSTRHVLTTVNGTAVTDVSSTGIDITGALTVGGVGVVLGTRRVIAGTNITVTGGGGGSSDELTADITISASGGGGGGFYQTVRLAGTDQTQEPKLNFSAAFTAGTTGGVSTDIGLANVGPGAVGPLTNATVTINTKGQVTALTAGTAPVVSVSAGTDISVSGSTSVTVSLPATLTSQHNIQQATAANAPLTLEQTGAAAANHLLSLKQGGAEKGYLWIDSTSRVAVHSGIYDFYFGNDAFFYAPGILVTSGILGLQNGTDTLTLQNSSVGLAHLTLGNNQPLVIGTNSNSTTHLSLASDGASVGVNIAPANIAAHLHVIANGQPSLKVVADSSQTGSGMIGLLLDNSSVAVGTSVSHLAPAIQWHSSDRTSDGTLIETYHRLIPVPHGTSANPLEGLQFQTGPDGSSWQTQIEIGVDDSAISMLSFFGSSLAYQQALGTNLTNSLGTSHGTARVVPNFTSLTVYSTDAQAIHDGISWIADAVLSMQAALKTNGLCKT